MVNYWIGMLLMLVQIPLLLYYSAQSAKPFYKKENKPNLIGLQLTLTGLLFLAISLVLPIVEFMGTSISETTGAQDGSYIGLDIFLHFLFGVILPVSARIHLRMILSLCLIIGGIYHIFLAKRFRISQYYKNVYKYGAVVLLLLTLFFAPLTPNMWFGYFVLYYAILLFVFYVLPSTPKFLYSGLNPMARSGVILTRIAYGLSYLYPQKILIEYRGLYLQDFLYGPYNLIPEFEHLGIGFYYFGIGLLLYTAGIVYSSIQRRRQLIIKSL